VRRGLEAERRREEEEGAETSRKEAEAAVELERQEDRMLRHSQDQEYHQSLLQDQMKDLTARQKALRTELEVAAPEVAEKENSLRNVQQRLERFGENPRLKEEISRSEARLEELRPRCADLEQELSQVEASIKNNTELLAAMHSDEG